MRVEGREAGRPEGLPEVDRAGDKGVRDPIAHGNRIEAGCRRAPLCHPGHHGRAEGEEEERRLLAQQGDDPSNVERIVGPEPAKPSHRPRVHEKQRERERDHHRLGQEPQGEGQDDREVPEGAPSPHPADVGEEREQPEERGEDVLAFRHPGHGLHVERVHREERSHRGASPDEPVAIRSQAKSSTESSAWISTETRWCFPASRPKSSTSAMWESQVSGCQLDPWTEVKAHAIPSQESPPEHHRVGVDVGLVVQVDEAEPQRCPVHPERDPKMTTPVAIANQGFPGLVRGSSPGTSG